MRSHAYLDMSLLGVLLGATGCQSMSLIREPVQPGGGTVEVRITPPRNLVVRHQDGSRTSLEAVSRIRGEPLKVRGDSVGLLIDSWRGGSPVSDHTETSAEAVLPTSDPQVAFFQDRLSVKKNLVAVAVVVGLVALAIGQASVGGY